MSTPFAVSLKLEKALANPTARTVTGWAAVVTRDDGSQVIDADDHIIPVEVLKRAVQKAFAEAGGAGRIDINHEGETAADLVESFVVTKENRKALGLGSSGREGWIATIRITDPDVIARVQSGELSELSLKGNAKGRVVLMPLLITEMTLDTAKLLSLVDAGASGDEDTRPAIVLFKRRKQMPPMTDEQNLEVAKIMKQVALAKMGVAQVVSALDEMGLSPEQRDGVLKMMEAMMGAPESPEAAAPEKADEEAPAAEPPPVEKAEGEEEEEMAKRAKEHEAELQKRDERIQKLEDDALTLRMEKRADDLGFLPGYSRDELIDLCKRADGDEKFEAMLVKLAKASKESPALVEHGATQIGDESSAAFVLNKRVKKLQDDDPKLTVNKAQAEIFKADPDLYKRYRAEQH